MSKPPKKQPAYYRKATEAKRRKYVENLVVGGISRKDAALAAGFSPYMAQNPSSKVETPQVLAAIESLEKALLIEIPTALLVQKFGEGLEATIVKTAEKDGEITDVKEFPDHPTRLKFLEKIALISGRYQPKTTTEHTGKDGGPIELRALSNEELKRRREWLERELGIIQPGGPHGGALPPPPGGPKTGGV